MASRDRKEEKAEGAARYAADEIKSAREDRQSHDQQHRQQQLHRDDYATTLEEQEYQKNRPGLISSVVGALGSSYEHAKEAVTGKTHDAAEKTREAAEATSQSMQQSRDSAAVSAREKAELARQGRDNTAESLRQTKDSAVGTTKNAAGYAADTAVAAKDKTVGATKDAAGYAADTAVAAKDKTVGATKDAAGYVGDKTRDATDYTAEKAKEGKDTTVGKLSELKDRAMGYLSGKKDETKEKVGETAQAVKDKTYESKEAAKDIYMGTEDEARRKMEERRIENLRDKGYNTVVDEDVLRGDAGKNTIFGAIGNMAEAVKSKLTMPGDNVLEGGKGREVTVTVEESPPGAAADILKDVKKTGGRKGGVGVGVGEVADLLKDADQITGQSFSPNDVGRMGGEGKGSRR